MRKLLLCGALAAATAIPAIASAQAPRCVNPRTNATSGALVGAAGGAAVGAALDRNHAAGALLGALGGAIVGGAVGSNSYHCPDGYYRYEGGHYYDNSGAEYYPSGGPPPPGPGYGPPPPGPGYGPPPPGGPGYGGPPPSTGFWQGAPTRIEDRIAFTEQRVHRAADRGWISPPEADRAYRDIADVRRYQQDARYRNGGHLRPEDRQYIMDKLDYIGQRVHWEAQR